MQSTAPNPTSPSEAPSEPESEYVSDAERRTRVSIFAGGIMIGASLAWALSAFIGNLTGGSEDTANSGTTGVSTNTEAPGGEAGTVAYAASFVVRPISDDIALGAASSVGAGGSLKADVNDDLSPMKGDRHSTPVLGSIAIGTNGNPGFEDAPSITPTPLSEEEIQGFTDAMAAARAAAAAGNLSPITGEVV